MVFVFQVRSGNSDLKLVWQLRSLIGMVKELLVCTSTVSVIGKVIVGREIKLPINAMPSVSTISIGGAGMMKRC